MEEKTFDLAVFRFQGGLPALGRCFHMKCSLRHLLRALASNHDGGSVEGSCVVYTFDPDEQRQVRFPSCRSLHWNDKLEGERLLMPAYCNEAQVQETEKHLVHLIPIQIFLFNGDADCVGHVVVVPLGEPEFWPPRWNR